MHEEDGIISENQSCGCVTKFRRLMFPYCRRLKPYILPQSSDPGEELLHIRAQVGLNDVVPVHERSKDDDASILNWHNFVQNRMVSLVGAFPFVGTYPFKIRPNQTILLIESDLSDEIDSREIPFLITVNLEA